MVSVISPHLTKLKARREVNLLSGNASALAELPEVNRNLFHWLPRNYSSPLGTRCDSSPLAHSTFRFTPQKVAPMTLTQNITLAIISDPAVLPYQTLPPPIAER